MAAISVAAEWQLLYDRYYRKLEIYSMQWNVDLARYKVACGTFGGPIAVIRDEAKIVKLLAESAHRKLDIYNSAGVLLSSRRWDRSGGRIIGMAWTDDQTLVCVVQDGTVYRYNIRGELQEPNISLGKECFEQNVMECVFWGNGMVCITESYQLFCVSDFRNPNPCKLADPMLEDFPLCIAVIEPQYTMSGNVEVLLAVNDYVLIVDEEGYQTADLDPGVCPLQKMVVTRNGKLIAAFAHDGRLHVIRTDFSGTVFDCVCESTLPPDQIAWCGSDSVVLLWGDMLLMVGPGDPIRYSYDEPILLVTECDGVRILSNSTMEFLHIVPESTVSIFKIGSTEPAALLYEAWDHYANESAKADEITRLIRDKLPQAVEACIDAACHEFNLTRQKTLLRAANYGKTFCNDTQRDRFGEMCKTLRVLNDVRVYEVGIPLSIRQYKMLTAPVLIGRLINSHRHLLAKRISEYLGLNTELVMMHWACAMITSSIATNDVFLLEMLLDKLGTAKGISFAAIAAHADKSGRRKLAAMLVEHEPLSSKQVPLLLSIGEEDTALVKATESGDTDLVYLTLFNIWQKNPPLEFFGKIQARPLPRDLFIKYSRCYKHEFLKDFYLSTGQLHEVAFLLWRESWELGKNPMASKGSPLHGPRIKLIEKAQSLFAETKEHAFESKVAEEHAKLLKMQHEFEVSTKQPIFVGSSISDTIRTCIVLGNHKLAMKAKHDFKVSDKQWYWLKVLALATIRDWEALEKFSKEKRPPIGYRPFVEACIDAEEKEEALKYIPKLTDAREKAEAYARIGMAKEAADAASQSNDSGELLGRLKQTFAQSGSAANIFDTWRDRLSFQAVS